MNKYFNLIVIIIILIAVFLARQPFSQKVGPIVYEKVINTGSEKAINLWQTYESKVESKVEEFFKKYVLSKITREVEKRKEVVKDELEKETKKISENIWQKTKNFFSEQFKKLFE